MKARIALPATLVCLGLTVARADVAPAVVALDSTPTVETEIIKTPEIAICTLVPADVNAEVVQDGGEGVLPACDLPLPTITETDPATDGTDLVVVDITGQPAALETDTPVVLHVTGSEVQRDDGLVDPSLAYSSGAPAPEAALAAAVVSGTEAATALDVEATGTVIAAKRELTVTRAGGEVVIGD